MRSIFDFEEPHYRDNITESLDEDYENMARDLGQDLKESKVSYEKTEPEHFVDLEKTGNKKVKTRPIVGSDIWCDDQALERPDMWAEAYEDTLKNLHVRPESNTGYTNKALNKVMKSRWGQSVIDKAINQRPISESRRKKLESTKKRIQENF